MVRRPFPRPGLIVLPVMLLATGAIALAVPHSSLPRLVHSPAGPLRLASSWTHRGPARTGQPVTGSFSVSGLTSDTPSTVVVHLAQAEFTSIPHRCLASSTVTVRSYISTDGHSLWCRLGDPPHSESTTGRVRFAASVDAHTTTLTGSVHLEAGARDKLPPRRVTPGPARPDRRLRLLSSPDFLNYDIGNLAHGPDQWHVGRTANSTDPAFRRAIANVMDDWKRQHPDEVLVAGDLVDGHWGKDTEHTGNFGPVSTDAERVRALDEAARTYYPQYLQRFTARGLDIRPAVGDHELGDNPWPAYKRRLASTFRARFADTFTRGPYDGFRYRSHPTGENRFTAYAWRPRPDVQMVTIDVFDVTASHAKVQLDPDQLRWLRGVLAKARADGVKWIIVQGHVPILEPVHVLASSGLHYQGGERSALWHMFVKYHVNLYLCGEVHAVTASQRDGVAQITHGGAFADGLTNYLLLDFFGDHIRLTLRDYRIHDKPGTAPLWETEGAGVDSDITVDPDPITIGTASLTPHGLEHRSGRLLPWDGKAPY